MASMKPDMATLRALYAQVESICRHFKQIRQEASGIMVTSQMPDATLHLNDVLQATETATTAILDAAIAISAIANTSAISVENKSGIEQHLGIIYEACSFQDINGQRIKKVLQQLNALEHQLVRLAETARNEYFIAPAKDPLLNGPALSSEAPSQADIDALFKS